MPYRKIKFENNYFYHVLNRGVDKRSIFEDDNDKNHFLSIMNFYQYSPTISYSEFKRFSKVTKEKYLNTLNKETPIVEIISFCLMPNHFHLLIIQNVENGVQKFMSNLQNSYARYFNLKHKRSGVLFGSVFRAINVKDDEQLLHVMRYIHLNPLSSGLVKSSELHNYKWSSHVEYLHNTDRGLSSQKILNSYFKSTKEYVDFINSQKGLQRQLHQLKKELE